MKEISDLVVIPLDQSFYALSEIKLEKIEEDLLSGLPFDYLRGESEFYESAFMINENVLIPRPETELLVDQVLSEQKKTDLHFADIGTGSGCIGLSLLAKNPTWTGILSDISPLALEVAQTNAKNLRLTSQVEFLLSDRMQKIEGVFDFIISNPPYIKESSHRLYVHGSVDAYEPHLALYLKDNDYQEWFHHFFTQVYSHLKVDGVFYMEGHELELQAQKKQLEEIGFRTVKVIQDLTKRDRFLKASK